MRLLALLLLTTLVAACTSTPVNTGDSDQSGGYGINGRYDQQYDSAPVNPPDTSHVQEPIPKAEPRSRYGNPESYTVLGETYHVLDTAVGYNEVGYASWYGTKFQGERTSSGETYDMYQYSAANKVLPLPTYVRVTNLGNHKSVIVRVNDRGPFHPGRIIDLSWVAAKEIGMLATGTARVRVEAIVPGASSATPATSSSPQNSDPLPAGQLYLQLGAYSQISGANQLQKKLLSLNRLPPLALVRRDGLYKLWLGPLSSRSQQQSLRVRLKQQGFASIPVETE